MAKYQTIIKGNLDSIIDIVENEIKNGSSSASFEGKSSFKSENARCEVRVYERYSMFGGNRLSLNLTYFESGDKIFVSAITSGGSQAVFFKINTVGEENFLSEVENIFERLKRKNNL